MLRLQSDLLFVSTDFFVRLSNCTVLYKLQLVEDVVRGRLPSSTGTFCVMCLHTSNTVYTPVLS